MKYTKEKVKQRLKQFQELKMRAEPEVFLLIEDTEYCLIAYDDHCSFQGEGSIDNPPEEVDFATLDELFAAEQIDGICLDRDWDKIIHIYGEAYLEDIFDEEYDLVEILKARKLKKES